MINYAKLVGISVNNIYAALAGQRQVTTEWMNKLLSGIKHEFLCYNEFVIQEYETGQDVTNAYYLEQDEESLLEETLRIEAESMPSSSEKPQDK